VQTVSPPHRHSDGLFVQIAFFPIAAHAASFVQSSDGSGLRQIPQPANCPGDKHVPSDAAHSCSAAQLPTGIGFGGSSQPKPITQTTATANTRASRFTMNLLFLFPGCFRFIGKVQKLLDTQIGPSERFPRCCFSRRDASFRKIRKTVLYS
jgi:hypothetical protein